jgi:hypothetical protein
MIVVMRGASIVVLLVGCGRIGFDAVAQDSALAGDSPACTMPAVYDDFMGATACAWGATHNVANSDVFGGALHVTPPVPGTQVGSQCSDNTFAFDRGTFVEVPSVTTQATGYAEIQMFFATHSVQLLYYVDTGTLELSDEATNRGGLAKKRYDPVAMRWWALRPISTHQIVAQYSADGLTWTQFGPIKDIASDVLSGLLVFGAGYYGNETVASTTVFQHWNVCP